MVAKNYRPYSKSKFENKWNSSDAKIFSSVFVPFFAFKARLEVLKFKFCQIKLG